MIARFILTVGMVMLFAHAAQAGRLQIQADAMALNNQRHQVKFTGSVRLERDDFVLHCDQLVAHYRDRDHALQRADAFGHVRMRQGETHGTADKAQLDYTRDVLTLIGHAVVYQAKGRLEGATIVHDIRAKHTTVSAPTAGKARLIIEPDKSGKAAVPVPDWNK
ncbi:MAG: lipopolysaccharide transport periplasmic protein LptA [Zetaproteobacteria bacterium]|nr:MAG: lipopolysaccharide transport periplasmic protein LptA [Zetaproteobacteria bacterium]